jgi:hypothetical protein
MDRGESRLEELYHTVWPRLILISRCFGTSLLDAFTPSLWSLSLGLKDGPTMNGGGLADTSYS